MRKLIGIIILIIAIVIGAAFTSINTDLVTLNYYFGSVTLSTSVLILASLLLGVLIGALAVWFSSLRLRYDNRRLNKQAKLAEQEIDSLRVLPLRDIP